MRAKTWTGAVAIAAMAAAAVGVTLVSRAGAREPVREIHLVARGMTYFLEADPATPNPTLTVAAGERVRLVLSNETPGIDHDLAIPSLGLALDPLAVGASGRLDLRAPDAPGVHEYQCRPHAVMMKGRLVVVASR